jgi:hypothetical protein
VLVEAIRIVAVSSIRRTPAWLHIRCSIRLRPESAQKRLGTRSSRAHLDIKRLLDDTTAIAPILLQLQNDFLERWRFQCHVNSGGGFEDGKSDELAFDLGFHLLREETAKIGRGGLGPGAIGQLSDRGVQYFLGDGSGIRRQFP